MSYENAAAEFTGAVLGLAQHIASVSRSRNGLADTYKKMEVRARTELDNANIGLQRAQKLYANAKSVSARKKAKLLKALREAEQTVLSKQVYLDDILKRLKKAMENQHAEGG